MIIQMQTNIVQDDPRVGAVVEKAKSYKVQPEVRGELGARYGVVEIHLKDGEKTKTSSLSEHIFSQMPGVAAVHRVTPPKITLAANGTADAKHVKLGPNNVVGAGLPSRVVAGPCTVDQHVIGVIEKLAELGITMVRGGCWKPRSQPYSFPGHGEQGVRWLLKAAKEYRMEAVFIEVIESAHIAVVSRVKAEVGYAGTVVLWVGARTQNSILLTELGKQHEFPVMLKNSISATGVQNLFERAEWVLAGSNYWNNDGTLSVKRSMLPGNDNLILCLRGTEKTDPLSPYRFQPNHGWAETLRTRSWAPIAIDPSHSAGTMANDLVLKNLAMALQYDIDLVMVEGGYPANGFGEDGFRGLCDVEQSIPLERMGEVIAMVERHNRAFNKK